MEQAKVIARLRDGQLIKGYTNDFFPKKPSFHLCKNHSDKGVEVAVENLKALFFVKDFDGNPSRKRNQDFNGGRAVQGRKAVITFYDGEKMAGTLLSYDKERPGFFIIPADEEGNNERVFVVSAAVAELKFL